MRIHRTGLGGIAIAVAGVCGQFVVAAEEPADRADVRSPSDSPRAVLSRPFTVPPFRDSEYGDMVHRGDPDAPSAGHPHYDFPSKQYGHWFRPRAFGLTTRERCKPRIFRPRGFGNLSNPPATCYRIDYHPFVLEDASTKFGPSYLRRSGDLRCCGDQLDCENESDKWRVLKIWKRWKIFQR